MPDDGTQGQRSHATCASADVNALEQGYVHMG